MNVIKKLGLLIILALVAVNATPVQDNDVVITAADDIEVSADDIDVDGGGSHGRKSRLTSAVTSPGTLWYLMTNELHAWHCQPPGLDQDSRRI